MKLTDEAIRAALLRVETEIDKPEANFHVNEDNEFLELYAFRQLIGAGHVKAIDGSSSDGEA